MSGEFSNAPGFSTFEQQDGVLLALSGGVDSAVTAHILRQQGFAVQGLFILFSNAHEAALEKARQAARELALPFHVADAREAFEHAVVQPFCRAYCTGRTPSPCVTCNPLVKFRTLADTAARLGIPYLASGHYARVVQRGGALHIARAQSAARDQSYMLYALGQDILSRLCLPLGEFEKEDIRAMAAEYGLSCAEASDSQEICFIPDGGYARVHCGTRPCRYARAFYRPRRGRPWPPQGHLSLHGGPAQGPRCRLRPAYLRAPHPAGRRYPACHCRRRNVCGHHGGAALFRLRSAVCSGPAVHVQGAQPRRGSALHGGADGGPALALRFDTPVRAPAPGQAAVFYDGSIVLGGGIIADMLEQV